MFLQKKKHCVKFMCYKWKFNYLLILLIKCVTEMFVYKFILQNFLYSIKLIIFYYLFKYLYKFSYKNFWN